MDIEINNDIVDDVSGKYYDIFGLPCTYPEKIKAAVKEAAEKNENIDVFINSGGGDVFAAAEMYSALMAFKGDVSIHITGLAGSAASVIACAGKSEITPVGMMMVHCASRYACGNHNDMEAAAEMLKSVDKAIANAYRVKTGMTEEEALDMMERESWITADKAVEIGLVNSIMKPREEHNEDDSGKSEAMARLRLLGLKREE